MLNYQRVNHRLVQQFAMEIRDFPSEMVTYSIAEGTDLRCMADFNLWAAQFQQKQPIPSNQKSFKDVANG